MTINRKHYSKEDKKSFVSRWQSSGQRKIDFSRANGLTYDTFLVWTKRYPTIQKPFSQEKVADTSFVSIQLSSDTSNLKSEKPVIEIKLSCGSQINFHQMVPAEYLRALMR